MRATTGQRGALAAVIVFAVAIAAMWLVRLPMLQGNDENAHADYVFALYDAGRPYRVERTASAANLEPALRYLENATRFDSVRYLRGTRVVPGYGDARFVAALDADAPRATHALPGARSAAPFAAYAYPAGYYCLAALTMSVVRATTNSFTIAYYATRSIGLVLLAASLALAYRVLRMRHVGHALALTIVAAIAVFPMTSWVASYIQPDNLTFTLVTLALALATSLGSRPLALRATVGLGATLGALAFVKPYYALALLIACVPLVASALAARRATRLFVGFALLGSIGIPAIAFFFARFATPAGLLRPVLDGSHGGASSHSIGPIAQFAGALTDAYAGGISFDRFWLAFGWNDTPFFPAPVFALIAPVIALLSVGFAIAFVASRVIVARRLRAIARRDARRAIALACGDALVNAYVVWTAMLCAVFAASNGIVSLQGRYWLPVFVATIFISAISIRRIVAPRFRRTFSAFVARSWLAYSILAAPFALAALQARYYGPEQTPPPASVALVMHASEGASTLAAPSGVVASTDAGGAEGGVRLDGFALEGGDGSPVRSVDVLVDGAATRATYGIRIFNANQMRPVGFVATLATDHLGAGLHAVSLRTTSESGETTTRDAFELAITPGACGDRKSPRGSGGSARCR